MVVIRAPIVRKSLGAIETELTFVSIRSCVKVGLPSGVRLYRLIPCLVVRVCVTMALTT